MTDKWQFYSQTGVDGPEYGVRIRPGYVVVGFQLEDARQIVALQNASIQPEGDILEKAKAVAEKCTWKDESVDHVFWAFKAAEILPEAKAEVERLRSENERLRTANASDDWGNPLVLSVSGGPYTESDKKDARIAELEADRIAYRNLGSKIEELETYIERLEAAFLSEVRRRSLDNTTLLDEPLQYIEADQKAREALEQLRAGGKDE